MTQPASSRLAGVPAYWEASERLIPSFQGVTAAIDMEGSDGPLELVGEVVASLFGVFLNGLAGKLERDRCG